MRAQLAGVLGEPAGDVEETVAEPFRFAAGEFAVGEHHRQVAQSPPGIMARTATTHAPHRLRERPR